MKLHDAREVVRLSSECARVEHDLDAIRRNDDAFEIDVRVCGGPVGGDALSRIRDTVRSHLDRQMTFRLQTLRDRLDELDLEE